MKTNFNNTASFIKAISFLVSDLLYSGCIIILDALTLFKLHGFEVCLFVLPISNV